VQTFSCPSCGGTLEYTGEGRTVKCPYCGTVAQIPEALWQPAEQAQTTSQMKKWVIIFLVVTVVLPTCLGLIGTAVGIGGGLLAAIVPFVLAVFGH
jgi:LSD1 subclass zinc finger protein